MITVKREWGMVIPDIRFFIYLLHYISVIWYMAFSRLWPGKRGEGRLSRFMQAFGFCIRPPLPVGWQG